MNVLFRNVQVFDADHPDGMAGPMDLLVRGDRIAAIGAALDVPRAVRVIDGRSQLLLPGLINAHFHSPVNHLKGALPSLPLEVFMLSESPALAELAPTPREAYLRTLLAAVEMLRAGVTGVQDDAFFLPHPTPEIIDAVLQAYADCGIRATVALDQPEVAELDKLPFLSDLLPDDMRAELARPPAFGRAALLEAYQYLISRWHGAEGGRLSAAVSVSAPQRVTPDYFHALDELSRRHGIPLYAHMLETKLQRVFGEERLGGRSLVRYCADLRLLSPRMNIIHAVWTDDDDLDLIAGSGAVVAHNPISNLRLGSGVMPFRRLRDRGIPIALGTDEAIADDAVNMWAVAKMAGLIHNLSDPDYERWPSAAEVLDALFRGGARAMLRQDDLGVLAAGRLADLAMIDLDTLPFTPLNDLRRQLVYCENGSSVTLTMVAGRVVYEAGRVTTVDEAGLRAEVRAIAQARGQVRQAAEAETARWLPYYRTMYRTAAARSVGLPRRLDTQEDTARC